jgi:hypothetical protein
MDNKTCQEFSLWLDRVLVMVMPKEIIAYNFNMYEDADVYHIQLTGTASFSDDDPDWACKDIFSTGENIFIVERKIAGQKWEDGLEFSKGLISRYLEKGKYSKTLKEKQIVAIGFVDGDTEIIYRK